MRYVSSKEALLDLLKYSSFYSELSALGCLHQSLKELATKRMQQDKKVFEQNALQLLMPVRQLWTGRISQLLQLVRFTHRFSLISIE
jgi:hypothetical protein